MIEQALHWIVWFVEHFGYIGIFVFTFLESTFMPIPSEMTMVPAGYLVQQGRMDMTLVFLFSVAGTLGGSLFNYWLALKLGRPMLMRYGKYFFIKPERLVWIDEYFRDHGPISIFTGRLIPGVRHFISFPAGLARMNLRLFCLYTTLGGAIWMATLMALGYFIGQNELLLKRYLTIIIWGILAILAVVVVIYVRKRRVQREQINKGTTEV